jgi:hypothetical protein
MTKKKVKTELLSMTAYAKRKGVSYELIRRYCKNEPIKITLVNGKINPVLADKELADNVQINGNAKLAKKPAKITGENHTVEYNKAKARREKSKADLAELEYEEKAGLLVSIETVKREAEDLYRQYRDQMLNVVIRATKKLLGETNEFKFRRVLKVEIENAIKKIK